MGGDPVPLVLIKDINLDMELKHKCISYTTPVPSSNVRADPGRIRVSSEAHLKAYSGLAPMSFVVRMTPYLFLLSAENEN